MQGLSSIADYIRWTFSRMNAEQVFCGHGYAEPWDEAVSLVLTSLELPWDFGQALWHCKLTQVEAERIEERVKLRVEEKVPLAYLLKQAWFCDKPYYVDERVLVPRSPIAELIQSDFAPWLRQAPERVLDLCTGSGCIGIACAHQFPEAEVDLLDISAEALVVATRNIQRHAVGERVQALESDLFSAIAKNRPAYDLIVSNPPYVDADDIASMPAEFSHEPMLGLAAGHDGLDLVRKILREAPHYLSDKGLLVVELGNSWLALEQAYPDVPFTWVEFEYGGHGVFVMTAEELKTYKW